MNEFDECFQCEEVFPVAQLKNMYAGTLGAVYNTMWCAKCEEEYDPTPQEQWQVTS